MRAQLFYGFAPHILTPALSLRRFNAAISLGGMALRRARREVIDLCTICRLMEPTTDSAEIPPIWTANVRTVFSTVRPKSAIIPLDGRDLPFDGRRDVRSTWGNGTAVDNSITDST